MSIRAALKWGFGELKGHLKILLPLSVVFFIPEFFAKAGYAWPHWLLDVYKTAFFFILLMRAMKLTKPQASAPPKGTAMNFAAGELIKICCQSLALGLGSAFLAYYVRWRTGAFPLSWIPSLRPFDLKPMLLAKDWFLGEPLWSEGIALLLFGGLAIEVHVLLNFFGYIVADTGLGPIQAIRDSIRLSQRAQLKLWFFYALCLALNWVGLEYLFIVGAIFTFPATVLATVYIYRQLAMQEEPL